MQYDTLLQEKERSRAVIIPESTEEFNGIVQGLRKKKKMKYMLENNINYILRSHLKV